jgi:hypothetical protein
MTDITTVVGAGSDEFREYILRNPHTLIYSEPRFVKLVADHLEARCAWLVSRRDGAITGLLPFLVKSGPLGPVFNSLAYYGSNGGVIQVDHNTNSKAALVEAFYAMAADSKAASATIISNPLESCADFYDSCAGHDCRDERIGQITHLPASAEDLTARFDDPRPRNIRRAIKEGITVTRGATEALDFLFSTHVDNMSTIGGIAKKREFFDAIPAMMHANDWAVFTAWLDGKPIAALLVLYFNRTVEYFTPVIVDSYRNTQALSLVIYEAMRNAIQRGFTNWNWGGTWLNQCGIYDFKKRWGTSEYRYFYYTRVFCKDLTNCRPAYLLEQYPGFYLIPFNRLAET